MSGNLGGKILRGILCQFLTNPLIVLGPPKAHMQSSNKRSESEYFTLSCSSEYLSISEIVMERKSALHLFIHSSYLLSDSNDLGDGKRTEC